MSSEAQRSSQVLRLLSESFLMWRRQRQRLLAPYAITLQQAFVLRCLQRDGPMHPSRIADLLYCDRPTASVVIRNMEKKSWITREPDPANRKYRIIRLARKGTRKLDELSGLGSELRGQIDPLTQFTATETADLVRLLRKLRAGLIPAENPDTPTIYEGDHR